LVAGGQTPPPVRTKSSEHHRRASRADGEAAEARAGLGERTAVEAATVDADVVTGGDYTALAFGGRAVSQGAEDQLDGSIGQARDTARASSAGKAAAILAALSTVLVGTEKSLRFRESGAMLRVAGRRLARSHRYHSK
jgi:hypothetical protein